MLSVSALAAAFLHGCTSEPQSVGTLSSGGSGLQESSDVSGVDEGESDAGTTSDGPRLDASPGDDTAESTGAGEGCTYVDMLFVIDNSASMGGYQAALGMAFPQFAGTLASVLPPGTNVHVGVTSSEMGYSSGGTTQVSNGSCTFTGDGGMNHDAFYVTPDQTNTGRNGAQGRLFDPGDGKTFYEFETDADLSGVQSWFASAAAIGTGGSNIEMSAAPVAWVDDPSNAATNAGFIRDQGAVLVVFFMQDEPDQSPWTIDGQPGGNFVLQRITAAKAGCGGAECIIAGGFLEEQACSANGNLPLDDLLAGLGGVENIQALPDDGDPAAAAAQMNLLLSDTLAEVIATKCDQIPPAD